MNKILCNATARSRWTALALLVCVLALPTTMLAQIPDDEEEPPTSPA